MKYEKNRKIFGIDELLVLKYLRILALPAVIVLLVLIILLADHPKKAGKKTESAPAAAAAATEETETPAETEAPYDYANAAPEKCTDDSVMYLVREYLEALRNGDAASVYRIFGRTDETGLEELKAEMAERHKLYDTFENIAVYTVPGVEDGSCIVYISADVWFKKVQTPAPMFLRTYCVTGSDGMLRFQQDAELSSEELAAVTAADASEAVRKMNNDARNQLARAVVSDAKLGSVYEKLKEGAAEEAAEASASDAAEAETAEEAVVVVGETESAAAESSAPAEAEAAESSAAEETEAAEGSAPAEAETAVQP